MPRHQRHQCLSHLRTHCHELLNQTTNADNRTTHVRAQRPSSKCSRKLISGNTESILIESQVKVPPPQPTLLLVLIGLQSSCRTNATETTSAESLIQCTGASPGCAHGELHPETTWFTCELECEVVRFQQPGNFSPSLLAYAKSRQRSRTAMPGESFTSL